MIVLDTHAWIWWRADPARLSAPGARAIAEADRIGVSSISVWELGMLVRRGRISLDRNVARWVRQALSDARIAVLQRQVDLLESWEKVAEARYKAAEDSQTAVLTSHAAVLDARIRLLREQGEGK